MQHKKIAWIIGCRPNFIKLFRHPNQIIIHTGQHFDKNMNDIFFKQMNLPKVNYYLQKTDMGAALDAIKPVLVREKPDYVLVMGDTNSAMAGALAAAYLKIPIIHLEAGLRSFNREMPEEINRVLIDVLSDIFLCPSESACIRVEKETGKKFNVFNVGSNILDSVFKEFPTRRVKGYEPGNYSIFTLHRQSNVDDKDNFKTILDALDESEEPFLWPIHPRAEKMMSYFGLECPTNVKIIDPLDHRTLIHLMAFARQIVTDSGGIQVESYFLRKPCVTVRTETEWIETVEEGWNIITGINKDKILDAIIKHLPTVNQNNKMSYGKGEANEKIKEILASL